MTFSIERADKNDLENKAHDAERNLIRTLDALAERRRQLRDALFRVRATLKSGALTVSVFLALGATRMLGRGGRRSRGFFRGGALFLLGASVGLLALALGARGGDAEGAVER